MCSSSLARELDDNDGNVVEIAPPESTGRETLELLSLLQVHSEPPLTAPPPLAAALVVVPTSGCSSGCASTPVSAHPCS